MAGLDPIVLDKVGDVITEGSIDRLNSIIRPFPLPPHLTPTGKCDFSEISEETLLSAPPHLLVHLQRTAAQGGMQVVSPRQTPMSVLMTRTNTVARHRGDHTVGSVADMSDDWPTIDGASFADMLPDEPIPPRGRNPAIRRKTKSMALTSASHLMRDPILACLVKGRAVIDVLNRPDVVGDGRAMVTLLSDAWGIDEEDLMDLDAFTLGFDGSLLRHAIRVDDVYPMIYAPIHQRMSISVGSTEASIEDLPADSALDWRRFRVFCEAVFAMSLAIEGISMKKIRCSPPPGDMSTPGNRPNTLTFMPAPCTAWTFSASTFSMHPIVEKRLDRSKSIPAEVLEALARYVKVVRPMSHSLAVGFRARTRVSHMKNPETPAGETISSSYGRVIRSTITTGARGRTAAAAVRSFIFEVLENCTPAQAMRLNRYIKIAKSEVLVHLQMGEVPDRMIDKLADKFMEIGATIRLKVVEEAARRGATATQWWHDITAQAAQRYKDMAEGTMGWTRVAMYFLFHQPTDKWRRLCSALNFNVMHDAAARSVHAVALPPEKESLRRLEAAARHVAHSVTTTYSSFYLGVYDVGMAIADEMMDMKKERTANILRHASYMWSLRARVFRAINVTILEGKVTPTKPTHYIAPGDKASINLAPAPYAAYSAYRNSIMLDDAIPARVKKMLPEKIDGVVSDVFRDIKGPMLIIAESELTKYLLRPYELADDMESAWSMLVKDMEMVLQIYGEAPSPEPSHRSVTIQAEEEIDIEIPTMELTEGGLCSYWEIIGNLEGEEQDTISNLMQAIGEENEPHIMEGEYIDVDDLIRKITGVIAIVEASRKKTVETVS